MPTSSVTLPYCPELDRIAEILSRGYGIDSSAGRLMLLQMAGGTAGRTKFTRTVDGIVSAPGFELAILNGRNSMIHGAQMALLEPVLCEFQKARDREASEGREHTRFRYSSLATKNNDLLEQRKAAEERLRKLTSEPSTMGFAQRETLRKGIKASIESLTEEAMAVQGEIADWRFASAPGIVRDEEGWLGFPRAGEDSFDGNFLQLASASSLLQEYETLPPKWFRESTELLRRSRRESPFAPTAKSREATTCSMQITGDPFTFARLFHDPKFAHAGFFSGFILVEADAVNAQPDLDSMAQLTVDERWNSTLAQGLTDRLYDVRHRLHLDGEGLEYSLEFNDWYWNFVTELPDQHRWSFSGWPPLLVSLAISAAIIEGKATGEILDAIFLRYAGELLKSHAPRQVAILESLQPKEEVDRQFEDRISRMMLRLDAQGPMTKRDLARTISGNDYGVIDALIAEAKRRGLVLKEGNHFVATGVNVNASTGKRVLDFQEGVAA